MNTAAQSASVFADRTKHREIKDEYCYESRAIIEYDENGKSLYRERPLTLEDFLEPQEGDIHMQRDQHDFR